MEVPLLVGLLMGGGGFPPGPHQRADAGAEAAGDPEPAPAAAADAAAAAAGAAADADDARARLEHDPQHGGHRWHPSNHEQPTHPAGKCTAVSISSKLRYWFHSPSMHFVTPYSPMLPPLLGLTPWPTGSCLAPWEQWKTWQFGHLGGSTFLALVPVILQHCSFFEQQQKCSVYVCLYMWVYADKDVYTHTNTCVHICLMDSEF